jgi:hypothetical protein
MSSSASSVKFVAEIGMLDVKWSLGAGVVEAKAKDGGVAGEVGVGGEDGPVAGAGYGTDEDIGDGDGQAGGAAFVGREGGGFIVGSVEGFVGKGTQRLAQFGKLRGRLDAGEQLLADQADEAGAAFANELGKFGDERLLSGAEIVR